MDDQLKQSALDFHEFPVPGKIRVSPTKPLWQRSAIWRWPTHQGVAAPVLKSKRPVKSLQIYRAR